MAKASILDPFEALKKDSMMKDELIRTMSREIETNKISINESNYKMIELTRKLEELERLLNMILNGDVNSETTKMDFKGLCLGMLAGCAAVQANAQPPV